MAEKSLYSQPLALGRFGATGSLAGKRLLWVSERRDGEAPAAEFIELLRSQQASIAVVSTMAISSSDIDRAQLVIVEALDQPDGVLEMVIPRIRVESTVPLVFLMAGYSSDQLISTLSAGADALWSTKMAPEIFLARVQAMLRRS